MAKSYSSSAILKQLKAGTECACLAVFETCRWQPRFPAVFLISAVFTWRHGSHIGGPQNRPCWCTKPVLWELNSFLM